MLNIIFGKFENEFFNTKITKEEIDNIIQIFKNNYSLKTKTRQLKVFQKNQFKLILDTFGNQCVIVDEIKNLYYGKSFICFDKFQNNYSVYEFENHFDYDNISIIEKNELIHPNFKIVLSIINNTNEIINELKIEFKDEKKHLDFLNSNFNFNNKKLIIKEREFFIN